jgi:hypothetical protein
MRRLMSRCRDRDGEAMLADGDGRPHHALDRQQMRSLAVIA